MIALQVIFSHHFLIYPVSNIGPELIWSVCKDQPEAAREKCGLTTRQDFARRRATSTLIWCDDFVSRQNVS